MAVQPHDDSKTYAGKCCRELNDEALSGFSFFARSFSFPSNLNPIVGEYSEYVTCLKNESCYAG
jgi:hypothetical protein